MCHAWRRTVVAALLSWTAAALTGIPQHVPPLGGGIISRPPSTVDGGVGITSSFIRRDHQSSACYYHGGRTRDFGLMRMQTRLRSKREGTGADDNKGGGASADDEQRIPEEKRNSSSAAALSNSTTSSSSSSSAADDPDPPPAMSERLRRALSQGKARAEIDQILSSPEAPFDADAALSNLVGVSNGSSASSASSASSGIPPPPTPAEYETERTLTEVESSMHRSAAEGDYAAAAEARDALHRLHIDDCGAVLQRNDAFYRAFTSKSVDEMEDLWLNCDTVACLHPSNPPLVGYRAVMDSWRQIFGATSTPAGAAFQSTMVEPANVRLSVKGCTAHVTCEERIYGNRFVRGVGKKRSLLKKLVSTNIFRKVDGRWYLVHHHASYHHTSEPGAASGSGGDEGDQGKSSFADILKELTGETKKSSPSTDESIDGIIGKPTRIVRHVSLGDLLGGGLGDLLSGGSSDGDGKKKGGDSSTPSLFGSADASDVFSSGGTGSGEGRAIIHINPMFEEIDEEDDEDDEEEEEEDDDDHEDDEDDDGEDGDDAKRSSAKLARQWTREFKKENTPPAPPSSAATDGKSSVGKGGSGSGGGSGGGYKDELRQNCITALRKLCDQGSISQKQKRVLLTDIITCSAKGEFSMVEVAYELLCGEGDADAADAAEEEFADQCRVFAATTTASAGGATTTTNDPPTPPPLPPSSSSPPLQPRT